MMTETPLSNHFSGYERREADWATFFQCWHEAALRKHAEVIKRSPDFPLFTLTKPPGRAAVLPVPNRAEAMQQELKKLEARIGSTLPRSYVDFVLAFEPSGFPLVIPGTHIHARGFVPVEEVDLLERRRPDIVEMEESYATNSEDSKYFTYGIKQDGVAVRTKYYRKSILVGIYSQHELLLLNPAVKTRDGEMEAILLLHSSAYRAPSFAELLRQVSLAETSEPGGVPPYPQEKLKGTCADRLPMKDVWWD